MINVSVVKSNDLIVSINIAGHSESADRGEDLICAGVSSIAVGTLNALEMLVQNTCHCSMQEACTHIEVIQQGSQEAQLILKMMLIQLETMQERYYQYIQIQKQEV